MSAFMTCHLYMDPLRHLRLLPSSPAGFRSTFDRLPYGCLLFMYRLDYTTERHNEALGSAFSLSSTGVFEPVSGVSRLPPVSFYR